MKIQIRNGNNVLLNQRILYNDWPNRCCDWWNALHFKIWAHIRYKQVMPYSFAHRHAHIHTYARTHTCTNARYQNHFFFIVHTSPMIPSLSLTLSFSRFLFNFFGHTKNLNIYTNQRKLAHKIISHCCVSFHSLVCKKWELSSMRCKWFLFLSWICKFCLLWCNGVEQRRLTIQFFFCYHHRPY